MMTSADEALKTGASSNRKQNEKYYEEGALSEDLGLVQHKTKRTINFNPTEGEVHDRERNQPWRIEVNHKTALANQRAEEEQWEKRRLGLARQVHEGLMHNYNICVGVSEVANLIKVGQNQRRREKNGEVILNKDISASAILVAAEKYDLARIAVLLDKVPTKPEGNKK